MKLNELSPKEGSVKDRTRVGRGIGSGKGKTGGRGVKGQKSRSGVSVAGFEGGQMPIYRRLPKRGFNNVFAKDYNEVSVERIQKAIDAGKLDKGATVDLDALVQAGIVRRKRDGVRLLGNGEIKDGVTFEVNYATKSAAEKVEKAGGSVKLIAPKTKTAE
ncbi:50S ribosomal protein L15 [Notoacmeibacter ruber]|uniref:Large ribosomal subunit protein uL15 n=1 Tax=Notoacmeibacter ruber TaxID=2670375 RepID=A0A3L7JH63_9HYPH|nr:50S ribosomal protein L15 [Notoacmeibacter ruber]RLQ87822.1 50S ribosomal protein L15 [Notoacmeibacter ruber]